MNFHLQQWGKRFSAYIHASEHDVHSEHVFNIHFDCNTCNDTAHFHRWTTNVHIEIRSKMVKTSTRLQFNTPLHSKHQPTRKFAKHIAKRKPLNILTRSNYYNWRTSNIQFLVLSFLVYISVYVYAYCMHSGSNFFRSLIFSIYQMCVIVNEKAIIVFPYVAQLEKEAHLYMWQTNNTRK